MYRRAVSRIFAYSLASNYTRFVVSAKSVYEIFATARARSLALSLYPFLPLSLYPLLAGEVCVCSPRAARVWVPCVCFHSCIDRGRE